MGSWRGALGSRGLSLVPRVRAVLSVMVAAGAACCLQYRWWQRNAGLQGRAARGKFTFQSSKEHVSLWDVHSGVTRGQWPPVTATTSSDPARLCSHGGAQRGICEGSRLPLPWRSPHGAISHLRSPKSAPGGLSLLSLGTSKSSEPTLLEKCGAVSAADLGAVQVLSWGWKCCSDPGWPQQRTVTAPLV